LELAITATGSSASLDLPQSNATLLKTTTT